jgi:hypothetical protein
MRILDRALALVQDYAVGWSWGTIWRGRRRMRVSLSSRRTTADDVDRAAAERALQVGAGQPV